MFVPRAEAPEVVAAATAAYRDHGNRDKRTRARIKFLLAAWGPERFREVVERDYLGRKLEDGPPAPPSPDAHRDHVGVHRQRDGANYVGVAPLVGRTDGDTLVEVAELARELGAGGSGSPPSRSWSCWTCPTSGSTRRWPASTSWPCRPSPASSTGGDGLHRHDLLQAGPGADQGAGGRAGPGAGGGVPGFDGKVRVNVNGCPNSCARYQLSDIGLAGGESAGEGNYQLHLGGDLGEGLAFGHRVRERVPAADTGAVVRAWSPATWKGARPASRSRPGCGASHPRPWPRCPRRRPAWRGRVMAFGYPVLLELTGRRAVVVGEFAVEAGKVEGLLVAGAEVTVIAKGPEAALSRLSTDPRVTVHRRGYGGPADLAGAVLCVASAAEPGARDAIAADARAAGVLVNVMDDVPNCDFAAPAIVRRGDLVVAVGTGGRAPALASRVRAELGERFGPGGPSWSRWSAGSAPPSPTSPTSRTAPAAGGPPSTWRSWRA